MKGGGGRCEGGTGPGVRGGRMAQMGRLCDACAIQTRRPCGSIQIIQGTAVGACRARLFKGGGGPAPAPLPSGAEFLEAPKKTFGLN